LSQLLLDAEALCADLQRGVSSLCGPQTQLVGITSGGAWLAERLHQALQIRGEPNVISSAMHRDDFAQRGLSGGIQQTQLNFDVNGADIVLLDDVLFTGRTLRAVLNELFDYGRPSRVRLAVLVDRGGRELPVAADYAAARISLPPGQSLALARAGDGRFTFKVETA
jgi:pyrimidine operon attenuation protein / uracil phosphoribosyltransferase